MQSLIGRHPDWINLLVCNVNEPRLLWLKIEPECALFGVHALATTSALISFSEDVSEWKGYGIISDNGLLFYLLLFPNLWDVKRVVKRNNFFSSELSTLWAKMKHACISQTIWRSQMQRSSALMEFPFQGTICLPKRDIFHKWNLPASCNPLDWCSSSLKSRSACKLHARTKETVKFQDLKAIKALWQCFEVHEKTWTRRNRAGFHEEKELIDGNTKQARILDKDNVRFPGENGNSSWKSWGFFYLDKDLCILLKQIMEPCSQKQRGGSGWKRRPKVSPWGNLLTKPHLFFPDS